MKVMIVERDTLLLETISEICLTEGLKVSPHKSCESALSELDAGNPPALILCDLFPPKNQGLHFHEALQRNIEWRLIPFVLMCASPGTVPSGVKLRLQKPFSWKSSSPS